MPPSKKIYSYDLRGRFVAEFDSLSDASRVIGVAPGNISRCFAQKQRTAGGYQWRQEKFDEIPSSQQRGGNGNMITNAKIEENLSRRELIFKDHGIVTKPGHREYGRHEIELGTMRIYFKPGKPVEEMVQKYSRVKLD